MPPKLFRRRVVRPSVNATLDKVPNEEFFIRRRQIKSPTGFFNRFHTAGWLLGNPPHRPAEIFSARNDVFLTH